MVWYLTLLFFFLCRKRGKLHSWANRKMKLQTGGKVDHHNQLKINKGVCGCVSIMESLGPVLQRYLLSLVPINIAESEDEKLSSETSTRMILQMEWTSVWGRHSREIEIRWDCRMAIYKGTIWVSQDLTSWSSILLLQLIFTAALEEACVWFLLRLIVWVHISPVKS